MKLSFYHKGGWVLAPPLFYYALKGGGTNGGT